MGTPGCPEANCDRPGAAPEECVCLCRRPQALGDSAPTRLSVVGLAQEGEGFEASGRNPQSHKGGEQDLESVAFVRGVPSNHKSKNPGGRDRVLDKQSALREAISFHNRWCLVSGLNASLLVHARFGRLGVCFVELETARISYQKEPIEHSAPRQALVVGGIQNTHLLRERRREAAVMPVSITHKTTASFRSRH